MSAFRKRREKVKQAIKQSLPTSLLKQAIFSSKAKVVISDLNIDADLEIAYQVTSLKTQKRLIILIFLITTH